MEVRLVALYLFAFLVCMHSRTKSISLSSIVNQGKGRCAAEPASYHEFTAEESVMQAASLG